MKLPKYAIENHQFTIVLIVLLVLNGIVSLINMPKSEDPPVEPSGSSVVVVYPGASPLDIEQLVVEPIESALNELDDIRYINSEAQDGVGNISIEFESGTDSDEKYSDVLQKVGQVQPQLPENIYSVQTYKWTVSDVYILQLAFVSETASYRQLESEAERLKEKMEKVPGIKSVEIWAVPEQEVRVSVDLHKLAELNIPLNRVMGAIQDANLNLPGGHIDVGAKRLNVKTSGSFESLDAVRNTIVHSAQGNVIYLKDVAQIKYAYEDITYKARLNGKRCIWLIANQKPGTNIFQIFSKLRPIIHSFKTQLPDEIEMKTVFDQSNSVEERVSGFFGNLIQGIILVGLVIFTAVSFRASIIVMLAIPVSILIGIGGVALSGYGLEQMSIAGLVIALGLLVDNAIVVTENSARFMRMGVNRKEAGIRGTSQVGWAVVSATATTVLAFIPIILMKDVTGDFIRSMPLTVVYTLTASLVISLTLTPYLSTHFLKVDHHSKVRPFRRLLDGIIQTRYRSILDLVLKKPVVTICITLFVFLSSLALFPVVGVSFFPKAEKGQFYIRIDLPAGSSLDQTDKITHDVENILDNYKDIQYIASNVGHGNPRLYYNIFTERHNPTHSHLFVRLKAYDRNRMAELINELREKFYLIPGAQIKLKELEQGSPVEAPVEIRVLGDRIKMLEMIAKDIESMLMDVEGVININNPLATSKSDLKIEINRDKAGMLGVPLSEIDRTVRASIAGLPVAEFRDKSGEEYPIVIRLPNQGSATVDLLEQIYVSSLSGQLIPLGQLADFKLIASPQIIGHYNLERSARILADVTSGYNVDKVTQKIIQKLSSYAWPADYRYEMGGELENREESFGGMGQAVVIAMIAIFSVLVLQFRSYSQPFIIFSALPLAVIGSIIALLVTGNTFSFTAFIGACSLVGIVVNNSIILVDYVNQLRAEGKEMIAALKEAGETRFVPILLTTLTTVGGLLPLTLTGGSLWAPMGWTIIGGLIFSTLLTLFIVPVLYLLYSKR